MERLKRKALVRCIAGMLSTSILISASGAPVRAEEVESEEDHIIVVSMGDSYSSGEGIEKFYGQDDDWAQKVNNPDWLAHRSQNSWSGQLYDPNLYADKDDAEGNTLSSKKDKYWYFVAASGAITDNFFYAFPKEYDKGEYKGVYVLEPQLAIFDQIEEGQVDYVTLTIGGNDVGFSDIVTSAVTQGFVFNIGSLDDKFEYAWAYFEAYGGIRDKLIDVYTAIAEKAGPQAHIIVVGYPTLLYPDGIDLFFSKDEATKINFNVCKFNDAIESIVVALQSQGMNISFVSVEDQFSGHEAYSFDPYIYGINPISESEDLTPDFLSKLVSSYSIHPNEDGAAAYADCVQARIAEIEALNRGSDINDQDNISDNPVASDEEIDAKPLHFSGTVLTPVDVVLKMFDALQQGKYEEAAECLDPAMEQQLDFWGGLASTMVGLFTGEYVSWGQLLLEAAGATDVAVIECYAENMSMESNFDLIDAFLPDIPGIRNLFCTEADVYVKYRYLYNGVYYVQEDVIHVRRFEWSGWRIETD